MSVGGSAVTANFCESRMNIHERAQGDRLSAAEVYLSMV